MGSVDLRDVDRKTNGLFWFEKNVVQRPRNNYSGTARFSLSVLRKSGSRKREGTYQL